jgi:hypothetical protein
MYNIHVTQNGVLKLLSNLNIHKDAGPEKIPTGLLRACTMPAEAFTKFFPTSINQSARPADWKEVFVGPIFKKGDTSRVSKYLPD